MLQHAPVFALALAAIAIGACTAQRQTARTTPEAAGTAPEAASAAQDTMELPHLDLTDTLPDDSAAILVQQLEAEPLASRAPVLRARLVEWMIVSSSLGAYAPDARPVDDVTQSGHRYADELTTQYIVGTAAWRVARPPAERDDVEAAMAGIRSMVAAYRNMAQIDSSLRHPVLDRFDELRRRGELRAFVERALRSR